MSDFEKSVLKKGVVFVKKYFSKNNNNNSFALLLFENF